LIRGSMYQVLLFTDWLPLLSFIKEQSI